MSVFTTIVRCILAAPLFFTPPAQAQDYGTWGERTAVGSRPNSVDVQPLPLFATAALGGYQAGALATVGFERAMSNQAGLFANLGAASVRLSEAQTSDALSKNVDPVPKKVDAVGVVLGGRFYNASATTDSWFGSLAAGVSRVANQWVYGDQTVNEGLWIFAPTVEGGYRWVWNNGFLIRLGVGAATGVYLTRDYNQVSLLTLAGASTTEDKVRRLENRQAVAPVVDFGIGYAF